MHKNTPTIGQKDLFLLMGGQKYPVSLILRSVTKKGYDGEALYHVIAKHTHYGPFSVDCSLNEIESVVPTSSK